MLLGELGAGRDEPLPGALPQPSQLQSCGSAKAKPGGALSELWQRDHAAWMYESLL